MATNSDSTTDASGAMTADLNMRHLRPYDRIAPQSAAAHSELEAAEALLNRLSNEVDSSGKLSISVVAHLVTLARIRTEKIEEACGSIQRLDVDSFRSVGAA